MEIIIPHRKLNDVSEVLKSTNSGGMTHYKVQERGMIKPEEIAIGRGTGRYTPEFIPRTKVEVILMDDQVEVLINRLVDKLGDALGGKIIISDVPTIIDLSTKRRGEDAM